MGADGVTVRTFPAVLGFGAGLAVAQGVFDYSGGKFSGYEADPNIDQYERKEFLRMNRRRPIGETIERMGEGRGKLMIYCKVPFADCFCNQVYMVQATGREEQTESRRIMGLMYLEIDEGIWSSGSVLCIILSDNQLYSPYICVGQNA